MKAFQVIVVLILSPSAVFAKQMANTEGSASCVNCDISILNKSVSPFVTPAIDPSVLQKLKQVKRQRATIIGNPEITFLNKVKVEDPFNVVSAFCKISVPGLGDSTAEFIGKDMNMLVTAVHAFTDATPAPDLIKGVRLRCGSRGSPAVFDFDQVVDIKIEVQGYYNSGERFRDIMKDPDAAIFSVVNGDSIFQNYKHFSFIITGNVSNHLDEQKKKIEKAGGSVSFAGFPGEDISIQTKSNKKLDFRADELYRSDSVKIQGVRSGYWTHTGATMEGASGGAIFLNRESKKPLLQGIHVLGLPGPTGKYKLYEPDDSIAANANPFVPLYQIQELIQQKNRSLWYEIRRAELALDPEPASPSSPSEAAPSSSAGSGTADSARTYRPTQPDTYPPRRTNF